MTNKMLKGRRAERVPQNARARRSQSAGALRQRTLAALAVGASLLAASTALAEPLVEQEGVIEVGTIDPWSSSSSGSGGGSSGPGPLSGGSSESSCLIPWFSGCLFEFEEEETWESNDLTQTTWYYYDQTNSDMSGYYVNLLGGTFFARVASGTVEEASGSGSTYESEQLFHEVYSNNLGYSEEHLDHTVASASQAEESAYSVSRLAVEAGANTPLVQGGVSVLREQNGESSSSSESSSFFSQIEEDNYFGIPLYGSGEEAQSAAASEAQSFWNSTVVDSNVYLVNPVDATTIEIIGLRLAKGDESSSGSSSSSESESSYTSIFGFNLIEQGNSESSANEYAFFERFLELQVDLASGTVSGGLMYSEGESSSSSSSTTGEYTHILGIPLYEETHSAEETVESQWREISFELDAANGVGAIDVAHWNNDGAATGEYVDEYTILGIGVGQQTEEASSFHSDGLAFGADVGGGALWLGASYVNESSESSSITDYTLAGNPLFGTSSYEENANRAIQVGAGSALLGTSVGAYYENASSYSADFLRLGGEDFAGISSEDHHTEYGADANILNGAFIFSLVYSDGSSTDAIHLAGIPAGIQSEYQEFSTGVSGTVPNPNGGNVLVYSFEHEETANDDALFIDDSTIGRLQSNVTSDKLNVIVLDGLASIDVGREFSSYQVFAGEDTEILDVSSQNVDAGVDHGAVGPVGSGGASAGIFFGYLEVADTIALALLLATWCVDPGVNVPYGTIIGALPGTAQGPANVVLALALFALCGGAPVPVPLFLLSPCIVVPLAYGVVTITAGIASGLVPVVGGTVGGASSTALGAVWNAYNSEELEPYNCMWAVIPDEVRNPQPVLAVMHTATVVSNEAVAAVWPKYDAARMTAYQVVDTVFNVDALIANPDGIPAPDEVPGMVPPLPVQPPVPVPALPI